MNTKKYILCLTYWVSGVFFSKTLYQLKRVLLLPDFVYRWLCKNLKLQGHCPKFNILVHSNINYLLFCTRVFKYRGYSYMRKRIKIAYGWHLYSKYHITNYRNWSNPTVSKLFIIQALVLFTQMPLPTRNKIQAPLISQGRLLLDHDMVKQEIMVYMYKSTGLCHY